MRYASTVGIGVVAGLRSMLAPAVISWAARLGALPLKGTWLAFLGKSWATGLFTALAVGELIADQLPATPSRKTPVPFAARIATGALSGAAVGGRRGRTAGASIDRRPAAIPITIARA